MIPRSHWNRDKFSEKPPDPLVSPCRAWVPSGYNSIRMPSKAGSTPAGSLARSTA
jgi:hypothetical protein